MDESLLTGRFDNERDIGTRQVQAFLMTSARYLGLMESPLRVCADHRQVDVQQVMSGPQPAFPRYPVHTQHMGDAV